MSRYFEIKEGSLEDSIVKNIQEKSVSVAQQKAAGIALAAKRGEKDPDELQGPAKEMMKMSEKDLEDFAKTKHKGLPMKKSVEEAYSTSSNPKTTNTSTNVAAYRKVFDAAMKKFNISTPSELKTDALRKKFFNYVDANYKAKNEMVGEAVKKIACVECDEVSTEAAWKKNKGFCPKCKSSSKGVRAESKNESIQEGDMKSAMKKMMGKDVKTTTSGASGFQKTMYHVSDDMQVVYNDKSNLGDVYYKGKNVDSFRGVGTPDMEKVLKKYMKKFGVKSEESKTMTGKPWSQVRVENK